MLAWILPRMGRFRAPGRLARRLAAGLFLAALVVTAWRARPMLWPPDGTAWAGPIESARTVATEGRASVLFVGDTHFGESYAAAPSETSTVTERGYDYPLAGVRTLSRSANLVVVNLETPLTHNTQSPLRYFKRWVHWGQPESSATALYSLGVRAASLANNHACDGLAAGLVDTRAALGQHGIAAFGAGANLSEAAPPYTAEFLVQGRRLRIAVLGTFQRDWSDWALGAYASSTASGTYPLAERTLVTQIRALRRADPGVFVVVYPHWGRNYAWHSPVQSELGRRLLDAGADIVVGHGAHLFQEIELYQERVILHSLGNFVFLSPGRYASRGMHPYSLAARLDFTPRTEGFTLSMVLYFLASDNQTTQYQPYVLGGNEFESASRLLLEGGNLSEPQRSELKRRLARGQDGVGQHLRLQLGTWRSASAAAPPG